MTPKKSEWKPRFIEGLRAHGNVSKAARDAGVSRKTVYQERKNFESFRDEWDDAIEEGVDELEGEARRRAFEGTRKPVYYKGFEVGAVKEFSDTLMIFLLKGRRPDVYGDRVKQEVTGKDGGPIQQEVRANFDLAGDVRDIDREIAKELEAEGTEAQEGAA